MDLAAPARAILAAKGLKPTQRWADLWEEEHAKAFVVAQMAQEQQLSAVRDELVESLKSGTTLREFTKTLGPRLEKMGWKPTGRGGDIPMRLRRIYKINRRTARAAGQWQRIQRTKEVLPYLLYQTGTSRKHRPDHVGWRGILLPADDAWWQTHYPPNGWGCKCWVRQIGRAEYGRRVKEGRVTTVAPPIKHRLIDDPSGEIRKIRVPVGVDAGWAYNPGAAPWEGISRGVHHRANRLLTTASSLVRGEERAKRLVKKVVSGPGFQQYVTKPPITKTTRGGKEVQAVADTGMPVAILDKKLAGEGSRILTLKPSIADKQNRRHLKSSRKDLKITDYSRVQEIVELGGGKVDGNRRIYEGVLQGMKYRLVLELEGGQWVLVSLFRPTKKMSR